MYVCVYIQTHTHTHGTLYNNKHIFKASKILDILRYGNTVSERRGEKERKKERERERETEEDNKILI
jgi:hypothetical protein